MRTLAERRKAAAYHSDKPTLTDQSAAQFTDLNVIVNQFLRTGDSPSKGNPRYGDFTNLPQDLRSMIDSSRSVNHLRRNLPPQLKDMPLEKILAFTPDQLAQILAPPPAKEEDKEKPKT